MRLSHLTSPPRPNDSPADSLESLTQEIGRQLLDQSRATKKSNPLDGALLHWVLGDPAFKTQLFRFIDVFPVLKTPEAIHAHLIDYLGQPGLKLPRGMNLALGAAGLFKGTLAATITRQIEAMAGRFIAGRDAPSALPLLRALRNQHVAFSVDLLGEACLSDAEAATYQNRYLDLIEKLPQMAAVWPADSLIDADHLGPISRANVSIKISSLYARTNPQAFDASLDGLWQAIAPLLQAAARLGVLVHFDMEQQNLKDLTLALFERSLERIDFPAGIAVQAYLKSIDADVERLIKLARRTHRAFAVRLIKGAYWDYETIHAEMMNWPSPVWNTKAQTDAAFERATAAFVSAIPTRVGQPGIKLALGSHNIRSVAHGLALVQQRGLPQSALEIQMLHGMAENLKEALVGSGLRLREYVPIGELIPGMAYLVRRLLENTSNDSWLRAASEEDNSPELLLAPPLPAADKTKIADHRLAPDIPGLPPFANEPPRDFADPAQRHAFSLAVKNTVVPAVANDTTLEQALHATEIAARAFEDWRNRLPVERSKILLRAASYLRARRDELSALIVHESHKTWAEADADVCEAIDFCEFYARAALDLFAPKRLGHFVGELNTHFHQARGVTVVIAPWNFPLAILTGITTAALVTGNTVLLKPAEQTPAIARFLAQMLWAAGIPRDVLHFLPGSGEVIGAALVRDPRIALIAFTGSKAVGLDILRAAAETPPTQGFIKKVICEMGGKNAIIVDASADLDEAVAGVCRSAFGYAGQKCSACSRCIVLDEIYDLFVTRLIEATKSWRLGDPADPANDLGPVIDEQAAEKIRRYITLGKLEGLLLYPTDDSEPPSPLMRPHVFTGILPHHRLAQEEIFGPVLSIMRAKDFTEALTWANSSQYKLTGGLYSRTPSHLDLARREFRVGDLYLNRPITGALVGRQPFGGLGLSGSGAQAGTRAYLEQFVEPRSICENTLRHGFAPMNTASEPHNGA